VESHGDGPGPAPASFAHQSVKDQGVAEMDSVKKTCGYNHLTRGKSCL